MILSQVDAGAPQVLHPDDAARAPSAGTRGRPARGRCAATASPPLRRRRRLLEGLGRLAHHLLDPRIDRKDAEVGRVGDLSGPGPNRPCSQPRHRVGQAVGVALVRPAQRLHHERRVFDRARQAALEGEEAGGSRTPTAATERATLPDVPLKPKSRTRRPVCGSSRRRPFPPRTARIRSATAAALPPEEPPLFFVEVERVAGRPEQVVVARAAEAHRRAVRLADRYRSCLLHALGEVAVGVDHVVAQRWNAAAACPSSPAASRSGP